MLNCKNQWVKFLFEVDPKSDDVFDEHWSLVFSLMCPSSAKTELLLNDKCSTWNINFFKKNWIFWRKNFSIAKNHRYFWFPMSEMKSHQMASIISFQISKKPKSSAFQ